MIIFVVLSLALIIIGAVILGYGISERDAEYGMGMIPLVIGCLFIVCAIDIFDEYQQNDVSICISDNIKTVEEVKTDGSIVKYNITLKDGTEFTVYPQEKKEKGE